VEQQAFEDLVRVLSRRTFDAIISQGVRVISGIRDEADRDGLTGLPNRRTLDRRLEREVWLARETGRPLSVAFVDVDDFRSVNKRFNWQMGTPSCATSRGGSSAPSAAPAGSGATAARSSAWCCAATSWHRPGTSWKGAGARPRSTTSP